MERIKTSYRITKSLHEAIKILARDNHISLQDLIDELLKLGYIKYMEGCTNEQKNL
jgi:predicted HicB family RNase H-like nuclease